MSKDTSEASFKSKTIDNHEINEDYSNEDLMMLMLMVIMWRNFPSFDMCKNFKFKLGMKFCLLKEFNAIMEHSMLNGREVEFVKNDHVKVKVVCKKR